MIPTNEQLIENAVKSVGRPSVYDQSMCNDALLWLARPGIPKKSLCARFSIEEKTLYRWLKEHEEFSQSVNKGIVIGFMLFVEKNYQDSKDRDVNTALIQLLGRNIYGMDVKEIDKLWDVGKLPADAQKALSELINKVTTAQLPPSVGKAIGDLVNMKLVREIEELKLKVEKIEQENG